MALLDIECVYMRRGSLAMSTFHVETNRSTRCRDIAKLRQIEETIEKWYGACWQCTDISLCGFDRAPILEPRESKHNKTT